MSPTFWSNTIWYILLGLATIFELVFILMKANNRRLVLALYITICGITFIGFEMITLMCLRAYIYYPKIFSNQHDDSVVGNLFSQTSVSASAIIIAVLHLRWYWYLIIAACYGLIEELFIHLGIYQHYWYRTWMTIVALLLLFWTAKTIHRIFLKHYRRAWRYLFIFFGLFTFHLHLITWASKTVCLRGFNETLFSNPDCSIVVVAGTYNVLLSVIMMFLYFSNIKWVWRVAGICFLYFAHYLAEKYQLLISKDGWFFVLASIGIWGMYLNLNTLFLDWLYPKPQQLASTP